MPPSTAGLRDIVHSLDFETVTWFDAAERCRLPGSERDSIFDVIARLRTAVREVEGLNVFLQPVQNLSVGTRLSKSLYQYTLQSDSIAELSQWGPRILTALQSVPDSQAPTGSRVRRWSTSHTS